MAVKTRSMTLDELIKAKTRLEAAIYSRIQSEHRKMAKAVARAETLASVKARGTSRRGLSLKGRKLPPRFRNPKNPKETWAGRGYRPRWLVSALRGGKKKLADFAVRQK